MAKCNICRKSAIIDVTKPYCRKHFIAYFESKVRDTIRRYDLLGRKERIIVACSGGKDSTTILYLLSKWGYDVTALAINEGIPGYRNFTLEDLKNFCDGKKIPLNVISFKAVFGFSLSEALKHIDMLPCNLCGTLRRHLLNFGARGFDKVVTGHNLDDECQSIMMNIFKCNLSIAARMGPVSGIGTDPSFVPRVKPLYLCYEKEVAAYAYLNQFHIRFNECPYASLSFRAEVRDFLNEMAEFYPGMKENIVINFLKVLPKLRKSVPIPSKEIRHCLECGEASSGGFCKACSYAFKLRKIAH